MSDPTHFWRWFEQEAPPPQQIEPDAWPSTFEKISDVLEAYDPDLGFELHEQEDGSMAVVVTAYGDRDKFDTVRSLVNGAPTAAGWHFVALKPPMGFDFAFQHEDLIFDPEHLWFLPLEVDAAPGALSLLIGFPDYDSERRPEFQQGACAILFAGLGEQQFGERVMYIDVDQLPESPEQQGYAELPTVSGYLASRPQPDQ